MLTSLLVILVICMFRYLEERTLPWLVGTAVTLGFAFLTMEASFIFGGMFGIFLVLALAAQLWACGLARRRTAARGASSFRALVAVALPLLARRAAARDLQGARCPAWPLLGLGGVLAVLAVMLVLTQWRWKLRVVPRAGPDRPAPDPGHAVPVRGRAQGGRLADQPVQQPGPDHASDGLAGVPGARRSCS